MAEVNKNPEDICVRGFENCVLVSEGGGVMEAEPHFRLFLVEETDTTHRQLLVNFSDLAVSLGEDYCVTLLGCRRLHRRLQMEGEGED